MHSSSYNAGAGSSYQSGGLPTFGTSNSGGAGNAEAVEAQNNLWETRYGMRVDILAAVSYLLGPITGELVKIVFVYLCADSECL